MDFCICDLCQCCAFNIFFLIKTFLVPDVHKKIRLVVCVSQSIFPGFCLLACFPYVGLLLLFVICPLLLESQTITDIFSVYVFLTTVPLHVLIFLLAPVLFLVLPCAVNTNMVLILP